MLDERVNKLPTWAKILISQLQDQVNQLESSLALATQTHNSNSTGLVKVSHSMGPTFNLHDFTTVHFSVNDHVVRVHLRNEHQSKVLEINSDTALHIEPRAVNNIYIR